MPCICRGECPKTQSPLPLCPSSIALPFIFCWQHDIVRARALKVRAGTSLDINEQKGMRITKTISDMSNMVYKENIFITDQKGIALRAQVRTGSPGDQTLISPGRRRRHVVAQNAPLLHVRRFFLRVRV